MGLHVGRIGELLHQNGAGELLDQPVGAFDGALDTVFRRCGDDVGAEGAHQDLLLATEALRHDEDAAISAHRRDEGQADAGVAGGRLDDGASGLEAALPLGSRDHRPADAILDAAAGIHVFQLGEDARALAGGIEAGQCHQGHLPDAGGDVGRGGSSVGHAFSFSENSEW